MVRNLKFGAKGLNPWLGQCVVCLSKMSYLHLYELTQLKISGIMG